MSFGYIHTCNSCGHFVRTSGPYEFYRDKKGNRKLYGHPCPGSRDAEKHGISGYSAILYCYDCDKSFDLILDELKNPESDGYSANLKIIKQNTENPPAPVKCPVCGNAKLVLDGSEIEEIICPLCGDGVMISEEEWIS